MNRVRSSACSCARARLPGGARALPCHAMRPSPRAREAKRAPSCSSRIEEARSHPNNDDRVPLRPSRAAASSNARGAGQHPPHIAQQQPAPGRATSARHFHAARPPTASRQAPRTRQPAAPQHKGPPPHKQKTAPYQPTMSQALLARNALGAGLAGASGLGLVHAHRGNLCGGSHVGSVLMRSTRRSAHTRLGRPNRSTVFGGRAVKGVTLS